MKTILAFLAGIACAGAACGNESSSGGDALPCLNNNPGLHFVVHTPYAHAQDGYLSIVFSNGMYADFNSSFPFGEYPSGTIELRTSYPSEASDGPADVRFYTRPDPGRGGGAQVDVNLSGCTEVDIVTSDLGPDAG